MSDWIKELCGINFMPHGQCYLWNPNLMTLHVVSDSLIALAYFSIPITIFYYLRRRKDVPFPFLFLMLGSFIVACGATHLIEVWTVWQAHYWLSGGVKAFTALISMATAISFVRVLPVALTLPSPTDLQRLNEQLEDRVRERTAELTRGNALMQQEVERREHADAAVRQLNEELKLHVAELQTIFDLIPVGIGIASDPACREVRVNPSLAAMLGLAAGHNASLTAPAGERPTNFRILRDGRELTPAELPLQRAASGHGAIHDFEETIVRDDGSTVPILASAVPIVDQEGQVRGSVVAVQDLTQRKRAEGERLNLERKMLDTQKLESLGVMAGGIAHDFNNLLTGILGNSTLASMEIAPASPLQAHLTQINDAALRAADLCKQMLAYAGRGRFIVQKLDLGALVKETTHLLQISISKKVVLRFEFANGLPPIEADPTQIRQVVMNLVINASEAIGDKSGVVRISTGLTRVDHTYLGGTLAAPEIREGDYVSLEISDTGCGMSPETQAKIFDPFFSTKFTGRGLGLAAVLGIMRGHNGALKVYSELGRGTNFKLLFPVAGGVAEASRPPSNGTRDWRGSGCILVVDDEETIRSTLALMLKSLGFEVALTSDGREAITALQAEPDRFVLVLLDLTMPHLDGAKTFTELRRIRPELRVVLMSGFNERDAIVQFNGKGLASFLQKPFRIESLVETLRKILGQ